MTINKSRISVMSRNDVLASDTIDGLHFLDFEYWLKDECRPVDAVANYEYFKGLTFRQAITMVDMDESQFTAKRIDIEFCKKLISSYLNRYITNNNSILALYDDELTGWDMLIPVKEWRGISK